MDFTNDIAKVKDLLAQANDVLVVTHEHPTFDSIGSALALYLGLSGMGKRVTIACPDPVTVELSSFVGANKVVSALGRKNFIISLDYVDGSIEKVSYNIEGNKFNLVVEPRPGFEMFSQDKVHYSYAGSAANVIVAVDTIHLGGLKKLYEEDKDLYATKPIINIDRHPNNAHYGHTNMVDPQASSTAEIVAQLLAGLGVALTQDIATNILNALVGATNNFQNANVGPVAFELAASAMKAGGKRFSGQAAQEEVPSQGESVSVEPKLQEQPAPLRAPAVASGQTQPVVPKSQPAPAPTGKAPPDWLKPKIFKSTNLS